MHTNNEMNNYNELITPFAELADYQPIHHKDFAEHHEATFNDAYMETLFANQLEHCSRFQDMVVKEAGICKNDLTELNDLGLL